MKRRVFLIVLLVFMLLVLAALAGLFLFLRAASTAPAAVESPGFKHIKSIYGWGKNPDELLGQPFSVVWRNGSLYVTDKAVSEVFRLSPDGELLGRYGKRGRSPEEIWSPTGLEVDAEGNVYVTDGGHGKVVVYGPDGQFLRQASVEDVPITPLISGNRMFMTTSGSVKVLQLPDMSELSSWGSRGRDEEQFDYPNGVALDPESSVLYVADGNNLRVKAMDLQGNVRWIYGHPAASMTSTEKLFGLAGAAVFANGHLFVADPLDSVIHILDTQGKEVAQVGDSGTAEGLFQFPAGIAHMGGKRFAIAEWGNSRIQIVEIDVEAAAKDWADNKLTKTEDTASSDTPEPSQETSTTVPAQ